MNNEHPFSEEHLNAYIDNQLDAEEAGEVLKALRGSPALNQRVCELRHMQDLMRHAYGDSAIPESRTVVKRRRWPRYLQGAAALLLLTVGAAAGWLAHDNDRSARVTLAAAQSRPQNIILHISTDDPLKVSDALDQAEQMLSRNKDKPFQLEIVANGEGLNLLRARYSSYPERTEELIRNYNNLSVMACARTLQAIREQGGDVELLPHIGTTESALERVVDRLQDGWIYIRV